MNFPDFTLRMVVGTADVVATPRDWAGCCELRLPVEAVAVLWESLDEKTRGKLQAAIAEDEGEFLWLRARDVGYLVGVKADPKTGSWWASAPDLAKAAMMLCRISSGLGVVSSEGSPLYDYQKAHYNHLLETGKKAAGASDDEALLKTLISANAREIAPLRLGEDVLKRMITVIRRMGEVVS